MSDYRDPNANDEYENDLDNQYQLNRDQATDDFANFDPARYLRERHRPTGAPDAESDQVQLEPYYGNSRFAPPPIEPEDVGTRGPRVRAARNYRSALEAKEDRMEERAPFGGGLFGVLLGRFLPGLGPVAIMTGCFGLMFIVGMCGMGVWLLGVLLAR